MHIGSLTVFVLQHVAVAAVQHSRLAEAERRSMAAGHCSSATRLDADQLDIRIGNEGVEHARGVAAPAHTGHDNIGQPTGLLQALLARLLADDRLKITDDKWKGMRANNTADDVMRVLDRCHPVAQRLVDGVAQRAATTGDRSHVATQGAHLEHVEPLPADIFFSHVHLALEAEQRGSRRSGHAVLTCAGFSNQARLAHTPRQQCLADAIVDLVGAGVIQILALEKDARPAGLVRPRNDAGSREIAV